jgi:hypothetical protein
MVDTKVIAVLEAQKSSAPARGRAGGGGARNAQNSTWEHPHDTASREALDASGHPSTVSNGVIEQRLDTQARRVGGTAGALPNGHPVPRGDIPPPIPAYARGTHAPIAQPNIPLARDGKGTYNHVQLNVQEAAK